MKKNLRVVLLSLLAVAVIGVAARPYVAVTADPGFGLAVSVRTSKSVKFTPVFTWRFSR